MSKADSGAQRGAPITAGAVGAEKAANRTPGPWRVERSEEGHLAIVAGLGPDCVLVGIVEHQDNEGATVANAITLATAPVLLAALLEAADYVKDAVERWPAGTEEHRVALDVWGRVLYAIAKASGNVRDKGAR